jgi:hypothetical protein
MAHQPCKKKISILYIYIYIYRERERERERCVEPTRTMPSRVFFFKFSDFVTAGILFYFSSLSAISLFPLLHMAAVPLTPGSHAFPP